MQYINRTVAAHAFTSTCSAIMQSKIPRPLKYKVAPIGDKIQRRGIAQTNNKNNKDIYIFSNTTPAKHHCQT